VIDIEAAAIVALVGSADPNDPVDGQVNGVLAARSSGSTLKPFLFAAAFDARRLAPDSVIDDLPIERAGWSPQNFDGTSQGFVTAAEALQRSLNVPAIWITEKLGLLRCVGVLNAVGIPLRIDTPQRGGLALAVGAVEVTLLDLTNGYATLGRGGVRRAPRLFVDEESAASRVLDPATCANVDEILSNRGRELAGQAPAVNVASFPLSETPWFMWKTGTSSGRRDAWAVGHNRRFAIGVWVGRFSGAGHTEFVGRDAAEPLLKSLFEAPWFRSIGSPPPAPALAVADPFSPQEATHDDLRIDAPADGAVFVAANGRTIVHSSLNRDQDVSWFLNDQLLSPLSAGRLELTPGSYQLKCVTPRGNFAVTRFRVE
jgi:penicillin-binding protein 1C